MSRVGEEPARPHSRQTLNEPDEGGMLEAEYAEVYTLRCNARWFGEAHDR